MGDGYSKRYIYRVMAKTSGRRKELVFPLDTLTTDKYSNNILWNFKKDKNGFKSGNICLPRVLGTENRSAVNLQVTSRLSWQNVFLRR